MRRRFSWQIAGTEAHAWQLATLLSVMLVLASCGGRKTARNIPPPPPPSQQPTEPQPQPTEPSATIRPPSTRTPLFTEEGYASWYGPGFHNRHAANGEIFDMYAMTAAHRDFPLNSMVRVTNLKTGHSVVVKITDRGPFVPDRIIDLSMSAAKAVDVWRPGTALVRLDVLSAPAPIDHGGRWCVQIGALTRQRDAIRLKEHLLETYQTREVIEFPAPDGGYWVRVKVPQDDKRRAQEIARETHVSEGNVFLVRLD